MNPFQNMTLEDVALHNSRVRKENRIPVSEDAVELEGTLRNDLFNECKRRAWILLRGSTAHRAFRTLGEPDATVIADKGRVFFFELKSRTGKLSPQQLGLKMVAERLGHTIHVIRSIGEFNDIVRIK